MPLVPECLGQMFKHFGHVPPGGRGWSIWVSWIAPPPTPRVVSPRGGVSYTLQFSLLVNQIDVKVRADTP